MKNKDTKTDYQKVVMAGDQKWEMVESTIGIVFLFEIHVRYFFTHTGNFRVPLIKNHPTQKANSHSKSKFDLSSYYINLLKNGSTPPPLLPSPTEDTKYEIPLDRPLYIFNCNKTVEAIILKYL